MDLMILNKSIRLIIFCIKGIIRINTRDPVTFSTVFVNSYTSKFSAAMDTFFSKIGVIYKLKQTFLSTWPFQEPHIRQK